MREKQLKSFWQLNQFSGKWRHFKVAIYKVWKDQHVTTKQIKTSTKGIKYSLWKISKKMKINFLKLCGGGGHRKIWSQYCKILERQETKPLRSCLCLADLASLPALPHSHISVDCNGLLATVPSLPWPWAWTHDTHDQTWPVICCPWDLICKY